MFGPCGLVLILMLSMSDCKVATHNALYLGLQRLSLHPTKFLNVTGDNYEAYEFCEEEEAKAYGRAQTAGARIHRWAHP